MYFHCSHLYAVKCGMAPCSILLLPHTKTNASFRSPSPGIQGHKANNDKLKQKIRIRNYKYCTNKYKHGALDRQNARVRVRFVLIFCILFDQAKSMIKTINLLIIDFIKIDVISNERRHTTPQSTNGTSYFFSFFLQPNIRLKPSLKLKYLAS